MSLRSQTEACLSAISNFDDTWPIFLLTDDEALLFKAKCIYGDRVFHTNSLRTNDKDGIHFHADKSKVRIGIEIMVDTYMAMRADRFIGNGRSNVSAMIAMLKDWNEKDCILVKPAELLIDRFLVIYIRPPPRSWVRRRLLRFVLKQGGL